MLQRERGWKSKWDCWKKARDRFKKQTEDVRDCKKEEHGREKGS